MNKTAVAAVTLAFIGAFCAGKLPGNAQEVPHFLLSASADESARVITITAKEFEYTPSDVVLRVGQPVTVKLTSQDHHHGFNIPSLKLRADVSPDVVSELTFTPDKTGSLDFFCDVFCGEGHEAMNGKFTVTE